MLTCVVYYNNILYPMFELMLYNITHLCYVILFLTIQKTLPRYIFFEISSSSGIPINVTLLLLFKYDELHIFKNNTNTKI